MDSLFAEGSIYGLILVLAVLTFATRAGGYLILSRFKTIHPRIEAALQAVPAAVLSTLVFPVAVTKGWLEALTMIVALVISYKVPPILVLVIALTFLAVGRQVLGL